MKYILTILTFLAISSIHAQITFEKGYYINNTGEKIEGFIKNSDWKNNPTSFEFKGAMTNDSSKNLSLDDVKEFAILETLKYERHQVKIDNTPDNLNSLGYSREPDFKEETVFLKVLVENNLALLRYTDTNNTTFFYRNGNNIYTLVYKRFFNINKELDVNNFYKQQLASGVNCANKKMPSLENLRYTETSLIKYFSAYGECTNSEINKTLSRKVENSFNVKVIAGVQSTNFSVDSNMRRTADFGNNIGFVPGIELEYLLPFNSQKWSLFLDARYQSFKAETPNNLTATVLNPSIEGFDKASYKAIDIGLGVRHYFLLNTNSKLYVGLNYAIDFSNDTEVIYEGTGIDDFIASSATGVLGIGAGYTFDKISAEIRYYTNRNSIGNAFIFQNSEYSNITFSVSYRFFRF